MTNMKIWFSVLALVGSLVASRAAMTVYPETGSLFAGWVLTANTNAVCTNAFQLNAGTSTAAYTTNLAADVTTAIDVSGAASAQFYVRARQEGVAGTTNGGNTSFIIWTSADGVIYATNFVLSVPAPSTAAVNWTTNIPIANWGSPGYMKLVCVSQTNISAQWFSNVTYRLLKTK